MKKLTLALFCGSFIFGISNPSYGKHFSRKVSNAIKTTHRRSSGVENRFLEKTSIERNSTNAQWMDAHPLSFLEVKTDPKTNQVVGVTPMMSKKGKEHGSVEFQQTKAQGMALDQLAVEKSQLFQVPTVYEHEMKNTEAWLKQGSALYQTRKALLGLEDSNTEALLERHAVLQFGIDFLGQHPGAKLSKQSGGRYAELQDGKYIQFLNWIQNYGVTHADVKHYLTTGEMRVSRTVTSSSAVTSPAAFTTLRRNSGSQASLESLKSASVGSNHSNSLAGELKTPPGSPRSVNSQEAEAIAVQSKTPPGSPRSENHSPLKRTSSSSSEEHLGETPAQPQTAVTSSNGWINRHDGMGWQAPDSVQQQWAAAAELRLGKKKK